MPGQYYTGAFAILAPRVGYCDTETHSQQVNPQAVNEPGFDVLTANVRSVLYMTHKGTGQLVAYVAIGALLVGSINWTGGKQKGATVKRGDELGCVVLL